MLFKNYVLLTIIATLNIKCNQNTHCIKTLIRLFYFVNYILENLSITWHSSASDLKRLVHETFIQIASTVLEQNLIMY